MKKSKRKKVDASILNLCASVDSVSNLYKDNKCDGSMRGDNAKTGDDNNNVIEPAELKLLVHNKHPNSSHKINSS